MLCAREPPSKDKDGFMVDKDDFGSRGKLDRLND